MPTAVAPSPWWLGLQRTLDPHAREGQAALGFCVNLLTILTVKLTSSISFKLISMAKNAAIVLISVPVFHNKISPTQAPPAATSRDLRCARRWS